MNKQPVDYFDRVWMECLISLARQENPKGRRIQTGITRAEARKAVREYLERKAQYGEVPHSQDLTWLASHVSRSEHR